MISRCLDLKNLEMRTASLSSSIPNSCQRPSSSIIWKPWLLRESSKTRLATASLMMESRNMHFTEHHNHNLHLIFPSKHSQTKKHTEQTNKRIDRQTESHTAKRTSRYIEKRTGYGHMCTRTKQGTNECGRTQTQNTRTYQQTHTTKTKRAN